MKSRIARLLLPALLLAVAGILVFARAMDRDLNHDEHQFLAPGSILAHREALPYRDYPLFHMPNLVGIYSDLFLLGGSYIYHAKIVSFIAALAMLAMILSRAKRSTRPAGVWLAGCGAALLLVIFDPLWLRTTGKTWNHEVSAAFAVAACVFHIGAIERGGVWRWAVSGALLSLSIGTRLTVAPLALAFIASAWLTPLSRRARAEQLAAFVLGGLAAALPTLYCFAKSPEAFLFCNLEFPRLRLADPTDERARETATLWRKARFFVKEVVRPGWALFAVFAITAARPAWRALLRREPQPALAFLLLATFCTAIGCAMPTRYQYQHWFLLTPILALLVAEAWSRVSHAALPRWAAPAAAACILAATAVNLGEYGALRHLTNKAEWFPTKFRERAKHLRAATGKARVLTLAPALVVEAKLEIYPEFATGPFAWRLAHLLPPEKRARFHVVAPDDLEDFLRYAPPDAILTGVEDEDLEKPLIEWAKSRKYLPSELDKKRKLWMPSDE